jgi:hypothetical protein
VLVPRQAKFARVGAAELAGASSPVRLSLYVRSRRAAGSLALPVIPAGAGSLGSGRRCRGREAIACDAEGGAMPTVDSKPYDLHLWWLPVRALAGAGPARAGG